MFVTSVEQAYELAVRHHQAGQLIEAERIYRRIIGQHPDHAMAHYKLALMGHQVGRSADALSFIEKAIRLNPAAVDFCMLQGILLAATRRFQDAAEAFRRVAMLRPDDADAYHSLGDALREADQLEEAIAAYQKALALRPDSPETYLQLGRCLHDLGEFDRAIAAHESALARRPDFPRARWSLSLLRLLKGDFKRGWADYESRWEAIPALKRPGFSQPLWDGSGLNGRRILLCPEQGFGDLIQAIRYVSMVRATGAEVLVFAPPELRRLWQTHRDIHRIVTEQDPQPEFDVHCPLMSLPRLFATTPQTIPATVPYLRADPALAAAWRARMPEGDRILKVGLAWGGRSTNSNERRRHFPLSAMGPLAPIKGVRFYSLQKGDAAEQAAVPPAGMELADWSNQLQDFADTAALLETLDLVISCDTAVAHLAGALGKPVWLLLSFVPDWRWQLGREDSPWYPTMRLFRQHRRGDWTRVIEHVADELRMRAAAPR